MHLVLPLALAHVSGRRTRQASATTLRNLGYALRMSRKGPFLPRKDTAISRSKEALYSAAWQIGIVVAIQRVRSDLIQDELAVKLGADQVHISQIETGK